MKYSAEIEVWELMQLPAYKEGHDKCIETDCNTTNPDIDNPYPENTDNFWAWNRGWNMAIDFLEPASYVATIIT